MITIDPQFVDMISGQYNYLPESPCIDTGDPAILDPDETISDIDAVYFDQSPLAGDYNGDQQLDILDIVEILNNCILSVTPADPCSCADMNQDDMINVLDMVLIIQVIIMT